MIRAFIFTVSTATALCSFSSLFVIQLMIERGNIPNTADEIAIMTGAISGFIAIKTYAQFMRAIGG